MDSETQEIVNGAETEIKVHSLGQFVNDSKNREVIEARWKELERKAEKIWHFTDFDIVTQSVLARLIHNYTVSKSSNDQELQDDYRLFLAIGYILGKEKVE